MPRSSMRSGRFSLTITIGRAAHANRGRPASVLRCRYRRRRAPPRLLRLMPTLRLGVGLGLGLRVRARLRLGGGLGPGLRLGLGLGRLGLGRLAPGAGGDSPPPAPRGSASVCRSGRADRRVRSQSPIPARRREVGALGPRLNSGARPRGVVTRPAAGGDHIGATGTPASCGAKATSSRPSGPIWRCMIRSTTVIACGPSGTRPDHRRYPATTPISRSLSSSWWTSSRSPDDIHSRSWAYRSGSTTWGSSWAPKGMCAQAMSNSS